MDKYLTRSDGLVFHFNSYEEATRALDKLKIVIDKYGRASTIDWNNIIRRKSLYLDARYGWKSLEKVTIRMTMYDGWEVKFPEKVYLNKGGTL